MVCCSCIRTVSLTAAEACLLEAAVEANLHVADGPDKECARALVRLGYLERLGRGTYAITEHGRRRLSERDGMPCIPGAGETAACPTAPTVRVQG
ncbi:MAG: hypothetical protein ACM31L_12180 [Actinomycetota bacterium]